MKLFNLLSLKNILFLLLLSYIFTVGIGNYGLLAHDEPRYASCALKMLIDHNYIIPKYDFNESMLADKPPLFCWLIAISYNIFGVSDFATRVPSVISAILLVLFTWYIGKSVLGSKTGFISAIILATSAEYLFLGRRASTDMVFCLFFSGAMYSMYLSYFNTEIKMKLFWIIASGIFAGLSILTKGPAGIVLQFLILTIFLMSKKRLNQSHIKIYFIIGFVALLISLPWYTAVHIATNGEFTKSFFFTHNLERFTSIVGKHPGSFWFYVPVLFLGFFPWILFSIPALYNFSKHLKNKKLNGFIIFNLIWILTTFIFFSICKTKLVTYILLIFPPIALLTGNWLCILDRRNPQIIKRTLLFLGLIIMLFLPVSYFIVNKSKFNLNDKNTFLLQIFISIGFFVLISLVTFILSKKIHSLILSFAVSIALPVAFLLSSFLTIYYKYTFADLRIYAILAHKMGANKIISFGTFHPTIPFYSRTSTDFNESKKAQIKEIYNQLKNKQNIFIIGHITDISEDKRIVKQNKEIFNKLHIIKSDKKYFLGKFN